jgi:hypothetical protein
MGDEQKEHVMKQVIGREQADDDPRRYQHNIHALLLWRSRLQDGTAVARSVAYLATIFAVAPATSYNLWIGNTPVLRQFRRARG